MKEDKLTKIPRADVMEDKDSFKVVLEVPGADKDKIDISVENNNLKVYVPVKKQGEEWKQIRNEFVLLDYERSFSLGQGIDTDKIDAHYENGLLYISLAKSAEMKPKKIAVKVA